LAARTKGAQNHADFFTQKDPSSRECRTQKGEDQTKRTIVPQAPVWWG
jgi:hypothetical protein